MLLSILLFLETIFCFFDCILILVTIQTSLNAYFLDNLIDSFHFVLLEITRTSLDILSVCWFRSYFPLCSIMTALGYLLFRLFINNLPRIRC